MTLSSLVIYLLRSRRNQDVNQDSELKDRIRPKIKMFFSSNSSRWQKNHSLLYLSERPINDRKQQILDSLGLNLD